jgi:microcompartment protein CcmL/EutN
MPALGLIETAGIAAGVGLADRMVKEAEVKLIRAGTICGGRYLIMISGEKAAVGAALSATRESAARIIGRYVIPQISTAVTAVLRRSIAVPGDAALALIEAKNSASAIVAADTAVKAADVVLARLVIGRGINGKAYFLLIGELSSVEAAATAAAASLGKNRIDTVILANPDPAVLHELTRN